MDKGRADLAVEEEDDGALGFKGAEAEAEAWEASLSLGPLVLRLPIWLAVWGTARPVPVPPDKKNTLPDICLGFCGCGGMGQRH